MSGPRLVKAPHGTELRTKGWLQEAALRCLMNNLDPAVAEQPDELVVYGGRGKAARTWDAFDAIVRNLETLENDETLLVQSGKPVAVFTTHEDAPRVLIANSNIVPAWATQENFDKWEAEGLIMYGQMTAGSWIYIGSQGIIQGTYETFGAVARREFKGTLKGKILLTGGLGGMGGAQPLAATMLGAAFLAGLAAGIVESTVGRGTFVAGGSGGAAGGWLMERIGRTRALILGCVGISVLAVLIGLAEGFLLPVVTAASRGRPSGPRARRTAGQVIVDLDDFMAGVDFIQEHG